MIDLPTEANPPYGIVNQFGAIKTCRNGTRNGTRTLQFEWDTPDVIESVAAGLALAIARCRPKMACFVFTGFDSAAAYSQPAREAGITVKPAAWLKPYPPPAGLGNWWPSAFELAYYGYRGSPFFGDANPSRSNVFVSDTYRHGQPGTRRKSRWG